jgi:circadian clock protein KaiB
MDDTALRQLVIEAITADPTIRDTWIDIAVQNGKVALTVDDDAATLAVAEAVRRVPGVQTVTAAAAPRAGKSPVAGTLRLYVAGGAPNSVAAEAQLRRSLGAAGATIEIIDVMVDKHRAIADGIVVTPTLVRVAPGPQGVLIGDLADADILAQFLGQ